MAEDRAVDKVRRRLGRIGRSQPEPGPKPEVVPERTNYGPDVDRAVEQARHNQRRYGVNAEYDLVRESFDHYHYLLQASDLHGRDDKDPIRHFLWSGASAPDPEIHFSMERYLERYPQHGKEGGERSPYLEWLKRGRAAGEIADPSDGVEAWAEVLGMPPADVVDEVVEIRTDMVHRLRNGVLGEMFAKAAVVEPLIAETWPETAKAKILPLRGVAVAKAIAVIDACQAAAGRRRARVVIVADDRPAAVSYVDAVGVPPEDVVVLVTGRAEDDGALPAGVRDVDFGRRTYGVPFGTQDQALVALLRSFGAEVILNVGSSVLYRALPTYGKALAATERIILCLLREDAPALGVAPSNNLRWLYDGMDVAEAVVAADDELRAQIVEHFALDEHQAATIQPVSRIGELVAGGAS